MMRERICKIVKWLLPLLFIAYMGGITFFTHIHIVNGVTIAHSHPYQQGSEHEHSTTEFELFQLLNTVLLTGSIFIGILLAGLFASSYRPKFVFTCPELCTIGIKHLSPRAPPAFYV